MDRDFRILHGTYLVHPSFELDLHKDCAFRGLHYSVHERKLALNWVLLKVGQETGESLCIEFREVSEFRFLPRDAEIPFSEDDCLINFGFWVDEDWADGVTCPVDGEASDPQWLTALEFMSGAVVAVQAVSAHAQLSRIP